MTNQVFLKAWLYICLSFEWNLD